MAARGRTPDQTVDTRRLTPLIGQAQHVWGKLRWEAGRIRACIDRKPFDMEGLNFGAINFAITATSLEDWMWKVGARKLPAMETLGAYRARVSATVIMQPAFRDIANTFKHGAHHEANWKGGTVELVRFPAFESTPKEYLLFYYSADNNQDASSLEIFDAAVEQWATFIRESGLFALLERPGV